MHENAHAFSPKDSGLPSIHTEQDELRDSEGEYAWQNIASSTSADGTIPRVLRADKPVKSAACVQKQAGEACRS